MARFESVPDFYQIRTGPKNNFFTLFHFEPIYEADRYGNYSLSYYSRGFIQNLSTDKDEAYTKAVELVGDAKAIRWEHDHLETVGFGRKLPRTPEQMEAERKAEAEKEAKRQAENEKWEAVYKRVASERKHTATYVRRYLDSFIVRLGPRVEVPWGREPRMLPSEKRSIEKSRAKGIATSLAFELSLGYDEDGNHLPGRNWVERIIVDLYHGKVPRGRAIDILSDCYAKGYGRTNSKAYKAGYAEADKMWDSLFKWQSKNNY
jgi:hypothetical protein